MHRSKHMLISLGLMAVFLIINCRPAPLTIENYKKQGDKVLATIGDNTPLITNTQLFVHIWGSDRWPLGGTLDTSTIRLVFDSLIMDTLVGLAAEEDIVLSDYYNPHWSYRMAYEETLLNAYFGEHVYSHIIIDSAMVEQHLAENAERLSIPEQVLFYHILVAPRWFRDGPEAEKYEILSDEQLEPVMKEYVDDLYQALINGEPFEAIAQEYSQDKMSQREGGLVGWGPRDRYLYPFDSVAFDAELGVVQPPYQDSTGWHIIKVTDKVVGGPVPLDRPYFFASVRNDLLGQLAREASGILIDSLRRGMRIEYNEPVLDRDVYKSDPQIVAGIVNGVDTIDFNHLRNYELEYRQAYNVRNSTPEHKKQMIDRLASRFVAIQTARAERMDTLAWVKELEYTGRHGTSRSIVLGTRYDPNFHPTDSAIEAYYQAHRGDYEIAKPVRIQRIHVSDSLLAEFIRDQAASGAALSDLAAQFSDRKAGRIVIADAPLAIGPDDVSREVWQRLNQIPVSSVTVPIKSEDGYTITKLLDRKLSRNLSMAKGQILSILLNEYISSSIRTFTDSLKQRYNVVEPNRLTPVHLKPLRYRVNMVL